MRGRRYGTREFKPRECLVCGKLMSSEDYFAGRIAFLKPTESEYSNDSKNTDYNGYCVKHTIDDILYKKDGEYHFRSHCKTAKPLISWFFRLASIFRF